MQMIIWGLAAASLVMFVLSFIALLIALFQT